MMNIQYNYLFLFLSLLNFSVCAELFRGTNTYASELFDGGKNVDSIDRKEESKRSLQQAGSVAMNAAIKFGFTDGMYPIAAPFVSDLNLLQTQFDDFTLNMLQNKFSNLVQISSVIDASSVDYNATVGRPFLNMTQTYVFNENFGVVPTVQEIAEYNAFIPLPNFMPLYLWLNPNWFYETNCISASWSNDPITSAALVGCPASPPSPEPSSPPIQTSPPSPVSPPSPELIKTASFNLGFFSGFFENAQPEVIQLDLFQQQFDSFVDSTLSAEYPTYFGSATVIDKSTVDYNSTTGIVSFNTNHTYSFANVETMPTASEFDLSVKAVIIPPFIMDYLWSDPGSWWYNIQRATWIVEFFS